MSPEEIKIKRGVIQELRSILKRLDSEAMDSELNPAPAEGEVEIVVPEPDQKDPGAMPNPGDLDPSALASLDTKEKEEKEVE